MCFVLWFQSCKHWWRPFLLIPISMLIFQMCGIVNTSVNYIDEFDFWYSLPITMPMVAFLWWISNKLNRYRRTLDLKDEIESEIQKLKQ